MDGILVFDGCSSSDEAALAAADISQRLSKEIDLDNGVEFSHETHKGDYRIVVFPVYKKA